VAVPVIVCLSGLVIKFPALPMAMSASWACFFISKWALKRAWWISVMRIVEKGLFCSV